MKGHFVFFPGAELVDGCGPRKKASANSRETVLLHSSEESRIPLFKLRYKHQTTFWAEALCTVLCAEHTRSARQARVLIKVAP